MGDNFLFRPKFPDLHRDLIVSCLIQIIAHAHGNDLSEDRSEGSTGNTHFRKAEQTENKDRVEYDI